jgi:hypothetical protein
MHLAFPFARIDGRRAAMADCVCAVAADTKVETPEGAMAIRSVAGKAIAVFTRTAAGRVRFRMMQNVRKTAEQQPVLTITLENGRSFRVAPAQILFKKGMEECRADTLQPGDCLETAFHFPEGYAFRDDVAGTVRPSSGGVQVASIEPAGMADVYALSVNQERCFALTVGVLCRAEDAPEPVS